MIDDVVLKWQIAPQEQVWGRTREPFNYLGFLFDPFYRDGMVIKYVSKFRNLRLVIKDDVFLISGSWHKFHHRENYGDYTWKGIVETIEELKERFGEKFLNAEITKLTIGCNLRLEANRILPKIIGINGNKPSDMLGGTNHQPYGKYFKMTYYRFKVYDKQFEVKNHNDKKIPHGLSGYFGPTMPAFSVKWCHSKRCCKVVKIIYSSFKIPFLIDSPFRLIL